MKKVNNSRNDWLEKFTIDNSEILSGIVEMQPEAIKLNYLSEPKKVADDTKKLIIVDHNKPVAVVIVSSYLDRKQAENAIHKSEDAKILLGNNLSQVIVEPLGSGEWDGLSWILLPYHKPYSEHILPKILQHFFLKPKVKQWLREVNKLTVRDISLDVIDKNFRQPLVNFSKRPNMNKEIIGAIHDATDRLNNGHWQPRHVFMHGDLWLGNILHANTKCTDNNYNFMVIDWAGSIKNGYAMFDLIRLAQSICLRGHNLIAEIDRHCRIMGCERIDAMSYLLSALGWLSMNLGCFPYEQFYKMADRCYMRMYDCINN